jgi:alkylated DNA repair dioxygenase AlkB
MKNFALAFILAIAAILAMRCEAQSVSASGTTMATVKYDCWYSNNHTGACYREMEQSHRSCATDHYWVTDSRGGKCYQRVSKDRGTSSWHPLMISADSDEFRRAGTYSCSESDHGVNCYLEEKKE